MTKAGLLSIVGAAAALAISFTAQSAHALICCSVCDALPDPWTNAACRHGCSPSCAADEENAAPAGGTYDEVAGVCTVASCE